MTDATMKATLNPDARPLRPDAFVALSIGGTLGALVLGSGGRLAMRGVTLWEHRPHLFSLVGTGTVLLWGAGFGMAAAALRLGLEAGFDRWAPAASPVVRLTSFIMLCLGAALLVLTPWTLPRLVLFPAVVVAFLAGFEALWAKASRKSAAEGTALGGHLT